MNEYDNLTLTQRAAVQEGLKVYQLCAIDIYGRINEVFETIIKEYDEKLKRLDEATVCK